MYTILQDARTHTRNQRRFPGRWSRNIESIISKNVDHALRIATDFYRRNRRLYQLLEQGDIEGDAYIALCDLADLWTSEVPFDAFLETELPKRLRSAANRMTQARRIARKDHTASIEDVASFSREPDPAFLDDLCQPLTQDERQIVELMAKGILKKTEIAATIGCGRETVSRRLASVKRKLREWDPNVQGSGSDTSGTRIIQGHHRNGEQRVRLGKQWAKLRAKDKATKGSKT